MPPDSTEVDLHSTTAVSKKQCGAAHPVRLFNAVPIRGGSFLCSNSLEIFIGRDRGDAAAFRVDCPPVTCGKGTYEKETRIPFSDPADYFIAVSNSSLRSRVHWRWDHAGDGPKPLDDPPDRIRPDIQLPAAYCSRQTALLYGPGLPTTSMSSITTGSWARKPTRMQSCRHR